MKKRDGWYLPDSTTLEPLGPFSHDQIAERLQAGELRFDEFIWNSGFSTERWVRIIDLPDFEASLNDYPKCRFPKKMSKGAKNVRKLKIEYSEELTDLAKENEFRRYPRAPFKADAFIHNGGQFTNAKVVDVSETGMFFLSDETDIFKQGEEVNITIMNHSKLGSFNIKSVIINARIKDGIQGYGIYFLHINPLVRRKIVEFVVDSLARGRAKNNNNTESQAA